MLKNSKARWDKPAITQVLRGSGANTFLGYSVRNERWRYTEWDGGKRGSELYDEVNDSRELRNLANDPGHAKIVAEMKQLMQNALK